MDTDTAFLHSWRTLTRLGSIAKTFATRRNCWRASSNGFPRRCETGASTVVTSTPFSAQMGPFWLGERSLLDREGARPDGRRPAVRPVREQTQLVAAAREYGTGGITPRDAEGVAARQHVAQPGEQPDASPRRAPQLEVESGKRQHCRRPAHPR